MLQIDLPDVPGPRFLLGYVITCGLFWLAALAWRHYLRRPSYDGSDDQPLHPYEAAYLAGGLDRLLAASVASLLEDGWLRPAPTEEGLVVAKHPPPGHVFKHPLDAAVLSHLGGSLVDLRESGACGWRAHLRDGTEVQAIIDRLQRRGLLVDDATLTAMRLWPSLLTATPVVLAVPRLVHGVRLEHPVGGLVVIMLGMALAAVRLARTVRPRTRRGDGVLERCRRDLDAQGLRSSALDVALFGPAVVAALLPVFPAPARRGTFLGGSGIDWGDSGGGGDGGGGGCGGGGCGGGGCGGCGG